MLLIIGDRLCGQGGLRLRSGSGFCKTEEGMGSMCVRATSAVFETGTFFCLVSYRDR